MAASAPPDTAVSVAAPSGSPLAVKLTVPVGAARAGRHRADPGGQGRALTLARTARGGQQEGGGVGLVDDLRAASPGRRRSSGCRSRRRPRCGCRHRARSTAGKTAVPPTRATGAPTSTPSTRSCTVPFGVPPPGAWAPTVALKLTASPVTVGCRRSESSTSTSALATHQVLRRMRRCRAKTSSPEYVATTWCGPPGCRSPRPRRARRC